MTLNVSFVGVMTFQKRIMTVMKINKVSLMLLTCHVMTFFRRPLQRKCYRIQGHNDIIYKGEPLHFAHYLHKKARHGLLFVIYRKAIKV